MLNSKNKGNSFERDISKRLSIWWSKNKRDDLFWRTTSSGGRYTVRKKNGKFTENAAADIVSTSEESKLFSDVIVLECKKYKDIDLWSIFSNSLAKECLSYWWNEIREISKIEEKSPVLIVKQDYRPTLWICDLDMCTRFIKFVNIHPKVSINFEPYEVLEDGTLSNTACIYLFDEIVGIEPDDFKCMLMDLVEI